jgi:hypothetical protein
VLPGSVDSIAKTGGFWLLGFGGVTANVVSGGVWSIVHANVAGVGSVWKASVARTAN